MLLLNAFHHLIVPSSRRCAEGMVIRCGGKLFLIPLHFLGGRVVAFHHLNILSVKFSTFVKIINLLGNTSITYQLFLCGGCGFGCTHISERFDFQGYGIICWWFSCFSGLNLFTRTKNFGSKVIYLSLIHISEPT